MALIKPSKRCVDVPLNSLLLFFLFFSCSVVGFKAELDSYLRNIVDLPCQPGFNNSLEGEDCLHGGHYADDMAAKQTKVA